MISILVSYQYEIYRTTVRENCSVFSVKYDIVFVLPNCCRAYSSLFLTLHDVLSFSCPVPGRVILGKHTESMSVRRMPRFFGNCRQFEHSTTLCFYSILIRFYFVLRSHDSLDLIQFNTMQRIDNS